MDDRAGCSAGLTRGVALEADNRLRFARSPAPSTLSIPSQRCRLVRPYHTSAGPWCAGARGAGCSYLASRSRVTEWVSKTTCRCAPVRSMPVGAILT